MFTEIENFERDSVNKQCDLVPGTYAESQTIFSNEAGTIELMLRKFRRIDEEQDSVIDCIMVDKERDEFMFQDYMRLASGLWRSGDGTEAETLLELLPADVVDLRVLHDSIDGDVIEVPEVGV